MSDEARLFSRFVRPIYDAIDSRKYKDAIKLAQNKKIASLDIVQILKAHCLERTGKTDEALVICRAVQKRKPTDETLLNTMGLVFRLCGCESEMLPSYEYACAAATTDPNEELFQLLFVAYARKGDFLKQQQTALKMFKAFGKIKYMCWAALSMLLQVQHTGAPSKMLALADRMLLKTMRDTQSDDGEALQLLVHILQLQDKQKEALEAFDEFAPLMMDAHQQQKKKQKAAAAAEPDHCHDHGCSHPHPPAAAAATGRAAEGDGAYEDDIELGPLQAIDRLTLEASLAKDVAHWKRSGDVYETLLKQYNADDWTYLTEFINARIRESEGDFQRVERDLLTTLEALQAKKGDEYLRGPWLALVHVQGEKLKHLTQQPTKRKEDEEVAFVDAILAYADRFYTKTCCFSDLKQYFTAFDLPNTHISAPSKAILVGKFQEMATQAKATNATATQDESSRKEALQQLHRRLLSLKSLRFLGAYNQTSSGDLRALATSLVDEYEANAWLNVGATGGQREVQNTDDLLLLAAHTLLEAYQREDARNRQHQNVLVDAAALLEYGLDKSAYNFQMKLLLSRVYGYLGASDAMLQRHKELDVKHVQLDSLSFLVLDKLLQLCAHTEARRVCDSVWRLHRSTASDTPEYITRAYKLGVYSKVLDMTKFLREKMQNSHTKAIVMGETLQFELQDALTGGPSKLNELLSTPGPSRFAGAIQDLRGLVDDASGASLSQNHHREVVVQWDQTPLVPVHDSFALPGNPLVECDRSASFASSLQWIKLQLIVPTMLANLSVKESDDNDANAVLAAEYETTVQSLGLLDKSDASSVKSLVWKWSVDVVRASASVASLLRDKHNTNTTTTTITSSQDVDVLIQAVDKLVSPLSTIQDGVITSLTTSDCTTLTSFGLSTVAVLLRDAGLWAGALLCATTRAAAKARATGKKDDPLVNALRRVLKAVQDTLVAVETHVKSLELDFGISTGSGVAESDEIAASRRKVHANVAMAQQQTQQMLSELLKNAATSMKLFLQK